jgi:hypothetical protein
MYGIAHEEDAGPVSMASRHSGRARELWAALAVGALIALIVGLARPFDAGNWTSDESVPSLVDG